MQKITIKVSHEDNSIRLDRLIRRHYPHLNQGIIEKSLRKNLIKLNGKKSESNQRLCAEDEISIAKFILENISPEDKSKKSYVLKEDIKKIEQSIIYRDNDIIVLNKPCGISVQGGSKVSSHIDAILEFLKFDSNERPKLVHRLDKDTSGVLIIARRSSVAAKLSECFRNKTLEKHYWAVVQGKPINIEGKIDLPIQRKIIKDGAKNLKTMEAVTLYKVIDYTLDSVSWLKLTPITGRTHQLRIHAAKLGTPILGDVKYGYPHGYQGVSNKLHLHARKIIIRDFMGKNLEFTAPIPLHMKQTFEFFNLSQ